MIFYLDTEFNGFGGDLISMALVDDDGREFYINLGCEKPVDWVRDNVIPVLNEPVTDKKQSQEKLFLFLKDYERIEIIADWPEDIAHFCRFLITGPGKRIQIPCFTFKLIPCDSESELPHNALSDARAIRKVFCK